MMATMRADAQTQAMDVDPQGVPARDPREVEATTAAEATVGEAKRSRGEGAADLHRPEHTLALGDHILVVRPEGGEDEHAHDFNRALSIRLRPRQLRREMV